MKRLPHVVAFLGALTLSCSGAPSDDGPGVAVDVAPLSLPGVTNARYRITVENGGGDQVAQVTVDADRYGDGAGSLSYVVPCDADSNDNAVTLEVIDLFAGDPPAAISDYMNPGPLTKTVRCDANTDVAVSFDVVLARQANQGFFDIAVEFTDLFCSGKLDCVGDGVPPANIDLLYNPSGARDTTVILALACTAGAGVAANTYLYLDDVGLDCDADGVNEIVLDPTVGPGNAYTAATPDPDPTDVVFQYAVFRGQEALTSGGDPAGKRFWNLAIGLDTTRLGAGCRLRTRATASDSPFVGDAPPVDTTYPIIAYDVTLSADGAGLMQCGHNPLNGVGSGVTTAYAAASSAPTPFDAVYAPEILACAGPADCPSGVCTDHLCQAATCADGVKNGAETAIDCGGGTCAACAVGLACLAPTDCASSVCDAGSCATPTPSVEYLVVGGGGGSGDGGGGGGGFLTGTGYAVTAGASIPVTVGAGGPAADGGAAANGESSVFGTLTALGGGGGGTGAVDGAPGGSGGGGYYVHPAGAGTSGQGYGGGAGASSGGAGGGGGGAGGAGGSSPIYASPGAGGVGRQSSISGVATYYAGGGTGYGANVAGGLGGGGTGGAYGSGAGSTPGAPNTGGGGGGGVRQAGGSGIVIIRYPDTYPPATSTTGSPAISSAGGYRIYTWTAVGTWSITF